MNTNITTQEPKSLSTIPQGYWGTEDVDAVDLTIPRIILAQGNSDLINSGKASPGDLIDSVNTTVLAKRGESLEFVPFKLTKLFQRSVKNPQSGKYEKEFSEPFVNSKHLELVVNSRLEVGKDGREYKNEAILICSCILPSKLGRFPFIVGFRSTSYPAGKKLANHFKECKTNATPPAGTVFKLTTKQQSARGNTWWAFDVQSFRPAKPEETAEAFKWWKEFSDKGRQVEVEEDSDEVPF